MDRENLYEFLNDLNKLTDKSGSLYSKSQIKSLDEMFQKISKIHLIPFQLHKLFFKILDNFLRAPESLFQDALKSSNRFLIILFLNSSCPYTHFFSFLGF